MQPWCQFPPDHQADLCGHIVGGRGRRRRIHMREGQIGGGRDPRGSGSGHRIILGAWGTERRRDLWPAGKRKGAPDPPFHLQRRRILRASMSHRRPRPTPAWRDAPGLLPTVAQCSLRHRAASTSVAPSRRPGPSHASPRRHATTPTRLSPWPPTAALVTRATCRRLVLAALPSPAVGSLSLGRS